MTETTIQIVQIIIVGTILLLLVGAFLLFFMFLHKKKLNEKLYHAGLNSRLEIQEQTLQHLSRELHDNLGQVASLIKINLNTLQYSDPVKAKEKTEFTKELTRILIADIKQLSVSLGSDHISRLGLLKALELELERINKTGVLTATLKSETTSIEISNNKAIILYRMVQEALHNTIKHAKANNISITINKRTNRYILAIRDDGVGFMKDKKQDETCAGLLNLKSRALLLNATIFIRSSPGKGTSIMIELPV